MKYIRGIAREDEWKMLTDPEWMRFVEDDPPVINGIINSYRNGYMKGVVILCPFCCCNHIHGGEITKAGIYGLRVSHCMGREEKSYWINIPEKALLIAKTYEWSFDAYSNYDKFHKRAKMLLKYLNGYVPDWMKVMDQRAKIFNKLKRLFRPSKQRKGIT